MPPDVVEVRVQVRRTHPVMERSRPRRARVAGPGALAVVVAILIASPWAAPSAAGHSPVRIDREAEDCTQIPPETAPPVAVSTEPVLPLEVRVLVEAADLTTAKGYMQTAKETYARIGIRMKVRLQTVVPPEEWEQGFMKGPSQDQLMEFIKGVFGGRRPAGVDVVYFMTHYWAGGFADCIGGVRFPDHAFAFGSIDYSTEDAVPSPTADEGVIAAHEIGHLLGAHHHYANCVEAQPSGALRGDTNPCTTMWPAAANASSTFSVLERSFIRAYAEEYAKG
jgi:reprolysin-like metallo-peptidase family M12B